MARDITRSVELNAGAPVVWKALTDPGIITQYFPGVEIICDWKPESALVFVHHHEGQEFRDKGVVLEVVPNRLLRYTYWSLFSALEDRPENYTLVTYRLTELGGKTTLMVTQSGFQDEEWFRNSEAGWENVLAAIKGIVETGTTRGKSPRSGK